MESAGRIEPSDVTITSPDQFHKAILSDDCGPVKILLQVRTDGSLRRLSDTLNDNLANESSKSLAQILKSPGISSKQRLLLAYTIAKSFWQLYGSSWTRTSWTTETIQLLSEDNKNDILYSSPFLDFSTQHPDCSLAEEPLREPSYIIHKYPRILGLAIILLEIAGERKASCQATSQPLQADTGFSNLPIKIAIDMKRIHNALRDPEWPDIDITGVRDAYKTILEQCASQTPFQQAKNADERRRVLYRMVVRPLKELLKDLKWLDDPVAPVKEVNHPASYIKGPSEFLSHQPGYVLVSYFRS